MMYRLLVFLLGERLFLKWKYLYRTKRALRLDAPVRYSEKLQWLKLYHRVPEMTHCADKIKAKETVERLAGPQYVIKTMKVFDRIEDLTVENLPAPPFILKTNHDSGGVMAVKSLDQLTTAQLQARFKEKLKNSFYYSNLEWEYKNIVPKIFAEELIVFEQGKNLLQDFKFHCFHGEPKFVQVITDRETKVKENWFNAQWEAQEMHYFSSTKAEVAAPANFEEMKELCRTLSQAFPYVRIDLYSNGSTILFGEFTFRPYGGFMNWTPDQADIDLGNYLQLPSAKRR